MEDLSFIALERERINIVIEPNARRGNNKINKI